MREIKFRAWDTQGKTMLSWGRFDLYGMDGLYGTPWKESCPLVFMQYTGLKDKNGEEIYEGDVIDYKDEGSVMESGVYQVVYKEGAFRPICELYHPAWPKEWSVEQTCKVLGNVYENPDLLP